MLPYTLAILLLGGCDDEWHHVFQLENAGLDNIHLFVVGEEEKSEANKVEPERSREYVVMLAKEEGNDGIEYAVEAHRGESLMASTICPPSDGDTNYEVVYTEANGPSLDCRVD